MRKNFITQRRKGAKKRYGSTTLRETTLLLAGVITLCGCQKREIPDLKAGQVKIEAAISPAEIMVGDSAELQLTVYAPSGSRIEDLAFPKELELQNRAFDSEPVCNTHTRSERRFQLTSFDLGEYPLTNDLIVVQADGTALTNRMEGVTLKVISSLNTGDDQTLASLKPPIKEKRKYGRVLAVMGVVALVALIIGMLTMWLITRNKQIAEAPKPKVPAHEIALDALKMLKQKGWIEAENAYEFYFELSQIWRYYLENRFALHAPESTTEELAEKLEKSDVLVHEHQSMLKAFLQQADRIKFAKETQTSAGMQQAYELCTDFVESTREQSEVAS